MGPYVFVINGTDVEKGDTVTDFRRQVWTFDRISRVPEPGKTGKVTVYDEFGRSREFYPTVFDGEIIAKGITVVQHRDGTFSIVGLTAKDIDNLYFGLVRGPSTEYAEYGHAILDGAYPSR